MRILLYLLVAGLLFSTFWFKKQQELVQKQLDIANDTVTFFQLNYPKLTRNWPVKGLDSIVGPPQVELVDSLNEIHRILWSTSQVYAFTIEEKKDGAVWLKYRRFEVQNPLTKEGRTAILFAKNMLLPPDIFKQFRQNLMSISFFDATRDENYMCCFTTGTLTWEAKLQKEGYLKHSTYCRQSVQFAEAYETIMHLVDDPQLQQALSASIK